MQSAEKTLRNAKADSQPNVNMTLEELFADLEVNCPPMLPLEENDLTRRKYAERYNLNESTASYRLEKLVENGILIKIPKRAENGSTVATYKRASLI